MKRFYSTLYLALAISAIYAQPSIKGSNSFLPTKSAFELYKKINKQAIATPSTPTGTPKTYLYTMPLMKDADGEIQFLHPWGVYQNSVILTNGGNLCIYVLNCPAPGFYLFQVDCAFNDSGVAEMNLKVNDSNPRQVASASMMVSSKREVTMVLGANLVQGYNYFSINCGEAMWFFYSLKISPLQ